MYSQIEQLSDYCKSIGDKFKHYLHSFLFVPGTKPWALYFLGNSSTTELKSHSLNTNYIHKASRVNSSAQISLLNSRHAITMMNFPIQVESTGN